MTPEITDLLKTWSYGNETEASLHDELMKLGLQKTAAHFRDSTFHLPSCNCAIIGALKSKNPVAHLRERMSIWRADYLVHVSEIATELHDFMIANRKPQKCTCDIMLLMAQGCKCGFLEKERNEQSS